MANHEEALANLHYQEIGPQFTAYGMKSVKNPYFGAYVGDPLQEAEAEIAALFDNDAEYDPRLVPTITSIGNGSVQRFWTDDVEYLMVGDVRDAAKFNKRGAPARVTDPVGLSKAHISLVHTFNEMRLGVDVLRMLRANSDNTLQRKGQEYVQLQMLAFAKRHYIQKQVFMAKAFSDGIIYISPEGEILESSSGNAYSIDLGVDASHKDQLDIGGDLISASWATASTKILDHLDDISQAAQDAGVAPPVHVWLHGNARRWFRNNDQLKANWSAITPITEIVNSNGFELNGFKFHFYSGSYVGQDGNKHPFIPEDQAIITPELGDWFFNAIGCELIPTKIGQTGLNAVQNDLIEVFGDFAFADIVNNPPRVALFLGGNYMYAFREPNAVWMPTVTGF